MMLIFPIFFYLIQSNTFDKFRSQNIYDIQLLNKYCCENNNDCESLRSLLFYHDNVETYTTMITTAQQFEKMCRKYHPSWKEDSAWPNWKIDDHYIQNDEFLPEMDIKKICDNSYYLVPCSELKRIAFFHLNVHKRADTPYFLIANGRNGDRSDIRANIAILLQFESDRPEERIETINEITKMFVDASNIIQIGLGNLSK